MSAAGAAVVIIGIGSGFRHDDGVGAAVVAALEHRAVALAEGIELLTLDGESTRLLEAWQGRQLAIVVDAVRSGAAPGSIRRVEVDEHVLTSTPSAASSHRAGLGDALALGRVLERLPGRLVIYGMEPADLSPGEGLSPEVRRALPQLIDLVETEATRRQVEGGAAEPRRRRSSAPL